MRLPYGFVPFRLIPKTFLLPLAFLFCAGLDGAATLHAAVLGHPFFQAESWWIPWAELALYNACLVFYLHPAFRLACDPAYLPANSGHLARISRSRLKHLGLFTVVLSIGLLFTNDFVSAMRESDGDRAAQFAFLNVLSNIGSGFFLGVLVQFFVENGLFAVKKRIRDLAPELPLPYQSLYFKIFLVLGAISIHLVIQSIAALPTFLLIDRPTDSPLAQLWANQTHSGALGWMRKNSDVLFNAAQFGASEILQVFFLRMAIYLAFIFLALSQIKFLIKKPLSTIAGRIQDLTAGRPEDLCGIEVVQNDEFSTVFREINRLIDQQKTALTISEQRLSEIVARAADPIVVFDGMGQIKLFNPAAQEFFGYTEDEAHKSCFTEMVDLPEEVACACEADALPLIHYLTEESSTLARHQGIHKNGTKKPFESNISTTQTSDGPLYTAVLRDIAGQLAIEENLTRAKVAAENANRMKSEFLANMSHELRTPLNAVLGFTQLLSNDKNLTGGQLDKIEIISRSGEHLLALINDILDISKIEAGKFEAHSAVFDLKAFVDDLRDMFVLKCQKKGLHLDVEILDGLPRYVRGDLGKLRQVMINLVGNAVKFTNEGGIGIVVGPDGDKIRFSVNDSGKGIPEAELDLILQPFMQSSNTDHEGGTGLGLTISHRFIDMMGGRLEVESQVDVGSTFSFALPLEATDEIPETQEPELKAVAVKEGREVLALIVDDKQTNRLILKEMLEGVGFTTIEAENGQEAVDRTREFHPRIVFMDIKMPVLDGYGAVVQIKADPALKAIPVFALTASAFKHDEEHIRSVGFDGFLAKPFKQSALFRLVRDKTDVVLEYETPTPTTLGDRGPDPEDPALILGKIGPAGLDHLDEMALINDFTAIRNWAETLRADLPGFAALLMRHASNFDEAALTDVIHTLRRPAKETP
jgi:PAS domain S-box-containing protein